MADNFLERHQEEYEKRKRAWFLKKRHLQVKKKLSVNNRIK